LTGVLLRFASVGVLNTLIGYAVIFLCMYGFDQGAVTSNVIGYAVGLVVSFFFNRTFTFRSKAAVVPEAVRFVVIFLLAYLANLGVLVLLTRHLNLHEGLSQVMAGVAYFSLSFVLSKYYVFGNPRGNAPRP
jgi:putative flippase GtrA